MYNENEESKSFEEFFAEEIKNLKPGEMLGGGYVGWIDPEDGSFTPMKDYYDEVE